MGGRGRDRGRRRVERECVSVRGGKRKKERDIGQAVFECVRGRGRLKEHAERENKEIV
jgi:hypothetical protein